MSNVLHFVGKEEIENGFDTIIPVSVIKEAKGLAIFTVVKAGFLWSGRAGSGIVVSRLPDGSRLYIYMCVCVSYIIY